MPTKEIDVMHLAGLIALIGLPFSKSKNALFGPYHVAAILAHMVRNGVCANAAIASFWAEAGKDPHKEIKRRDRRKVRFPTDQWLFRLFGSISPEEMEERCDLMLDAQMKIMRGAGIMNDAVIDIVDVHNVPHYGKKKDKHVVRTKHKNGTGKAESYATLLTTSGGYPYCTAITRLFAKRTKADIVAKLLDGRARRGIGALITMLDRGFFTVAVMQAFADRGLHFIMGAVRTAAVKKALDEYIAGTRKAISECTIRSGKKSFTFTLCIVEKTEVKKGKEKKVYRASGNQDPLRDRRLGASGGGGMRLESLAGVAAFRGAFPLPRAGHSAPECAVAALPVPFGGEERGRHARSLAQSRQPRRAALLSNQVQPGIPVQKVGHLHPVPGGPEVIRDGPAEVVEPRIVVVLRHRLL